jgi:uncharacterized protein (TIGR02145 family)
MKLVFGNSKVNFYGVSISNKALECEGPYISFDDLKTWQLFGEITIPNWKADSMLIAGKVYARCGETLLGPINCPSIKISEVSSQKGCVDDDRDWQIYQTIDINGKKFMAENLNYAGTDGNLGRCYNDSIAYCNKYGRLYDYNTAQNVCPTGWHLLNSNDLYSLGINVDDIFFDFNDIKKIMARIGQCKDIINCNSTGFTALPGGGGSLEDSFVFESQIGYLWITGQISLEINFDEKSGFSGIIWEENETYEEDLYSVRCVKDWQ